MLAGTKMLYQRVKTLGQSRWALWVLAAVAFCESIFFPIPPDVLIIPLVLSGVGAVIGHRPWWLYPLVTLVFSILGGIVGYLLGLFLMDQVGTGIIAFFGYQERFAALQAMYENGSVMIILAAGLTPIPYKVFTLTSGALQTNFIVFVLASIASRGVRFFLLAYLVHRLGPRFEQLPPWAFTALSIGALILMGGAYLAYRSLA